MAAKVAVSDSLLAGYSLKCRLPCSPLHVVDRLVRDVLVEGAQFYQGWSVNSRYEAIRPAFTALTCVSTRHR